MLRSILLVSLLSTCFAQTPSSTPVPLAYSASPVPYPYQQGPFYPYQGYQGYQGYQQYQQYPYYQYRVAPPPPGPGPAVKYVVPPPPPPPQPKFVAIPPPPPPKVEVIVPPPPPAVKAYAPPPPPPPQVKTGYADKDAVVVAQYQDVNFDGSFQYGYDTDTGISVKSKGFVKNPGAKSDELVQAIEGSYSYYDKEGKPVVITYIADDEGYRAFGDAIPQPPPEYVAAVEAAKSLPPSEEKKR